MTHQRDLTGRTPVEVDTDLAAIYSRIQQADTDIRRCNAHLDYLAKSRNTHPPDVEDGKTRLQDALDKLAQERRAAAPFESEFVRRGGWTRAFLVVSSNEGHVHSTMSCSTCRPSTQFIWLPQYSGQAEEVIVSDAGERACTTCYPSAPAEVRSRPTKVFSPAEQAAAEQRVQRQAARQAQAEDRERKAITMPDGQPLNVDGWGLVRTERTAQTLYIERAAELRAYERGLTTYAPLYSATLPALLAALAHKRDRSPEQTASELDPKVNAKVRRDWL